VQDASTKTIEVIATSPSEVGDDMSQKIAYSFVGTGAHLASDIYWDPSTGIEYTSSAFLTSMWGFAGGLLASLIYAAM